MPFDEQLFKMFHAAAGNVWFLDNLAIFFALYLPYILLGAALLTISIAERFRDKFRLIAYASLAIILSRGIIASLFYYFLPRLRPFEALGFAPLIAHNTSPAFPSGHAAFYVALACAFLFAGRKWLGLALLIGALFVSLAHVYTGLHWPSDILGGIVIAVGSACGVHWLFRASGAVTKA